MPRYISIALLLLLSACGEDYSAPSLYQAVTPECKTWTDGSRFELPRGIGVYAAVPAALKDGGVEIVLVYTLPRGAKASFATKSFNLTQPRGALIAQAKVVNIYQRGSNQRPEIVDVVERLPIMLAAIGASDETQWRIRLHIPGKLPQRFDLTPPDMFIGGQRYPVRTFTYRYFEERQTYGMCS